MQALLNTIATMDLPTDAQRNATVVGHNENTLCILHNLTHGGVCLQSPHHCYGIINLFDRDIFRRLSGRVFNGRIGCHRLRQCDRRQDQAADKTQTRQAMMQGFG